MSRNSASWLRLLAAAASGLLLVLAVVTWDVRQTLFDTDRWVAATQPVIERADSRNALSAVIVNRAVDRATCSSALLSELNATSFGTSARTRLTARVDEMLESKPSIEIWRSANRTAHSNFVRLARADSTFGSDRLLTIARLLEIAGNSVGSSNDKGVIGGKSSNCGGDRSSSVIPIVDARALHAASDAARVLRSVRILPVFLAVLALMAAAFALSGTGAARIRNGGVISGTVVVLGAVGYVAATSGTRLLTNGIVQADERELASAVVHAALSPTRAHLAALTILGIIALMASVWGLRRQA
jgi:hypothetical protein